MINPALASVTRDHGRAVARRINQHGIGRSSRPHTVARLGAGQQVSRQSVAGFSGFDWTFGLGKKKQSKEQKQEKAAAKQELREQQQYNQAVKKLEIEAKAKGDVLTSREAQIKQSNTKTLAVVAVAAVVIAGVTGWFFYRKGKGGKRKK